MHRLLRALAAHRPAQTLGLPGAEAGQGHGHLDHLILEGDRPERVGEDRLEAGVLVGDLVVGGFPQPFLALEVGMDGAALDRAGAHDRDLHRQVLDVLGPGARQHLHLRAALDLNAPVVSAARIRR